MLSMPLPTLRTCTSMLPVPPPALRTCTSMLPVPPPALRTCTSMLSMPLPTLRTCTSMLSMPLPTLRTFTLLCILLLTGAVPASSIQVPASSIQVPASSIQVLTFSPGDSVTLSCSEETNRTGDLTLIIWRKENGSHPLRFVSDFKNISSNFTDPRISFLSPKIPLLLQIRDAQPDDAGNYTCEITATLGRLPKSWTLEISESSSLKQIYIYSSIAGAFLIFIVIAGIIYCKCCTKRNSIPSQIHQTSAENNVKEEPVYDNAHEDYFLRFNTLYDTAQVNRTARRADNP